MLRTVLLMDGSEAMNSSSDYLPSYLLAMRPPLLRLVERYLDSTPLASLGIVVMRDGISHRLLPCTTNRNEIVDVLERDIFLHGGSGAMSLENGLRMAMSELVDMRKVAALAAHNRAQAENAASDAAEAAQGSSAAKRGKTTKNGARATWKGAATQLNIWVVSASVTLIDPTDVFNIVNTLAALSVRIHVVSLVGAVHVFDVCAVETGGVLYCPMNYDHLLLIVDQLATAHRAHTAAAAAAAARRKQQRREKRRRSSMSGEKEEKGSRDEEEEEDDAPYLIPIGCPVYLEAPAPSSASRQANSGSDGAALAGVARTPDTPSYYLACPQCHLIQLSVPTTCPMCRLLLCSAPMLYSTYVSHNSLVPTAQSLRVVRAEEGTPTKKARTAPLVLDEGGDTVEALPTLVEKKKDSAHKGREAVVEASEEAPVRCALCMTRIPASAATTTPQTSASSHSAASLDDARVWRCEACASYRCAACNDFVTNTIGMCPQCLALR